MQSITIGAGRPLLCVTHVTALGILLGWASNAQQFSLTIRPAGQRIELSWPTTLNSTQGLVFPEYEVERSSDLTHWEPIGGKVRGISGRSGPVLSQTLD